MKMEECIVSSVYPERGTVRVKREQSDGIISEELKLLHQWTLKNQAYTMPRIDEHVVCVFNGSRGYVMGAIYSEVTEPPVKDVNKHYIRFEDGTFVEYDTDEAVMTVNVTNPMRIIGDVHITGNVKVSENVDIGANLDVAETIDVNHVEAKSINVGSLTAGTIAQGGGS